VRGLLSTTEAPPARPAGAGAGVGASFAVERAWRLNPQVALRDEAFGALAYHYGNRRLVFLKSRLLVTLVVSLADHPSAASAIEACVPAGSHAAYERALVRLAASEVIDAR
jgi:putative mycofactocin binding protein MftB